MSPGDIRLDDEVKPQVEALMREIASSLNGKDAFVVYAALVILLGRACGFSNDPQAAAIRALRALSTMVGIPVISGEEEEDDDDEPRQPLN